MSTTNYIENTRTLFALRRKLKEDYEYRATGRTTRLVDDYIQKLYENTGRFVEIVDHYPSRTADLHLCSKIISRMENEHPHDKLRIVRNAFPPKIMVLPAKPDKYRDEERKRLLCQIRESEKNVDAMGHKTMNGTVSELKTPLSHLQNLCTNCLSAIRRKLKRRLK